MSFKLSIFNLNINHQMLNELGVFTIFCMKAIDAGLKIEDISKIILIDEKVIKKQLSFAISRKYLNEDMSLSKKGEEIVKLYEFINIFNQKGVKTAMEHYIEKPTKLLYFVDNKNLTKEPKGYVIEDNIYDYKMQNIFNNIVENDKNKIKEFILHYFIEYKEIIEQFLEGFEFKIVKTDEKRYFNYEIDKNELINRLQYNRDRSKDYIVVDIPMIEIEKIISSEVLDSNEIKDIQKKLNKYRYFNLLDGNPMELVDKKSYANVTIEPLISKKEILNNDLGSIEISSLLYINIQINIKKFYQSKFLCINEIMESI